ncbi:MAG: energy-coupled thiamine transporter ThiT [Chloroflexota bacterium]
MRNQRVRMVVEAGMAIALTAILHQIKVYQMPFGGAVTAGSMIPLLIIALRWGPGIGMIAGAAYGLIDYMFEPWFLTPWQFLLDYPVPFALLGLAGLLRRQPYLGVALGVAGRFASHLLSGVIYWAASADQVQAGMNPWVYSAIYNGQYLIPELILALALLAALMPTFRQQGFLLPAGQRRGGAR